MGQQEEDEKNAALYRLRSEISKFPKINEIFGTDAADRIRTSTEAVYTILQDQRDSQGNMLPKDTEVLGKIEGDTLLIACTSTPRNTERRTLLLPRSRNLIIEEAPVLTQSLWARLAELR